MQTLANQFWGKKNQAPKSMDIKCIFPKHMYIQCFRRIDLFELGFFQTPSLSRDKQTF